MRCLLTSGGNNVLPLHWTWAVPQWRAQNSFVFTWQDPQHQLNTSSQRRLSSTLFSAETEDSTTPAPVLTRVYGGTIESILCRCISAWYWNCSVLDRKTHLRVVRTGEMIVRVMLPFVRDIYAKPPALRMAKPTPLTLFILSSYWKRVPQ